MMQKRTLYSLLLTCLFLVFAFSSVFAQEVSFQNKTVLRCQSSTMNVTVNVPSDVSALELVFEVPFASFSVNWDAGFATPVLGERNIDIDGSVVRMYAYVNDPGHTCLGAGQTVVAQIDFVTDDVCNGAFVIDGTDKACPPPSTVVATTQFVDCATSALVPAVVNAGTVTVNNAAPTMTAIPDASVAWGSNFSYVATGTDNDLAASPGGCESLSFKKISGPAALTVSSAGVISWTTTGADVCEHVVEVAVEDGCGAEDTTSFTICVTNEAPSIVCPDDAFAGWGDLISGTIGGSDPDAGPGALSYSEVSFDGPGDLVVNPDGTWEWQTEFLPEYTGTFNACVAVNDGANICDPCSPNNADTCCFQITVVPFLITIEKRHAVIQGKIEPVSITMLDNTYVNYPIGGFDFLIEYDPTAMIVNSVEPGQFIDDCGWEYFTYRYGPNGNCGPSACPNGKLRIVAIAETNNGASNHPDCFTNGPGVSNELAVVNFLISNDRTLECQYAPIRFCWYDCGDNALSSVTGDSLFISRNIYDYAWDAEFADWVNIAQDGVGYPTLYGAQTADCFVGNPEKIPFRRVDFRNGGIDIVCSDSIDGRGDINLNEIPYEVADAVLFSNYFVLGISAFHGNVDGQIAATDANADGTVLSVADLVYLIRVVVGDAQPYPKTVVPVNASYGRTSSGVFSVNDNVEMGAAFMVIEGNAEPTLLADNMKMSYNFDQANNQTRILVYSDPAINTMESFTGEFLQVKGDVISVEMATVDGSPVLAKLLPTDFALEQNYPNPFNPTTTIGFSLPYAAQYDLVIYNVQGQQVAHFNGVKEAGTHTIDWEAGSLASGVYLYKLTADGQQIDTKKMVLLK
jgi:hypothetical protein